MFFFVTISLFVNYISLKLASSRSHSNSPTIDSKVFEEFSRLLLSKDDTHSLPAVLVDLNSFDRNVALLRYQMSAHPKTTIRIASKSLRVPFLLQRILSSGLPFKGLMCYAVEEAQFLSSLGFDDLLIAYPSQQLSDYRILRDLHDHQKKTVSIVVDHPKSINELNDYMKGISRPFPVILEFDVSFRALGGRIHIGARRSPIRTIAQLIEMIEFIQQLPYLHLEGLMVYESHIAGMGDTNPNHFWLNPLIRYVKRMSMSRIQQLRREMKQLCSKYGLNLLNGGGTGSLMAALEETTVLTEITIGSGFFQPHLFDHYQQNQAMINHFHSTFVPSCYFALPVVRISDEGEWVTCAGGGYVASGRPGWDKVPLPVFPVGLSLNDNEGAGEVQTPLRIDPNLRNETMHFFEQNRVVYFRHAKAGELAERFNFCFIVDGGHIIEIVKTYRGYGQCFF
ncbi:unnamed protein product [Rotaria socialis]|uniref:Alanine racemase N-terminal domain-containing protein n=2 Tax=Rotaria socialis TaxID=392032 RepID=A0A817TBV5_9BILA|nr:unnamed protein product [Rotaria socialis]